MGTLVTIISGATIFVLGQLFMEYIVKPLQKYKTIKSKVSYSLTYYGNIYSNPIVIREGIDEKKLESYRSASTEFRKLAAELRGFIDEIPMLAVFLPSRTKIYDASYSLIGLSNSLIIANEKTDTISLNSLSARNVRKQLGIYTVEEHHR